MERYLKRISKETQDWEEELEKSEHEAKKRNLEGTWKNMLEIQGNRKNFKEKKRVWNYKE